MQQAIVFTFSGRRVLVGDTHFFIIVLDTQAPEKSGFALLPLKYPQNARDLQPKSLTLVVSAFDRLTVL